jgi:hypothetical protein
MLYDYNTVRLMHKHPDGDWGAMKSRPESHPDPASTDPERAWASGQAIYDCDCGHSATGAQVGESIDSPDPVYTFGEG